MLWNGGLRRGSRRSSVVASFTLLALFTAGCGPSSSDQAAHQEKVQQVKDQIGQINHYIAHRTASADQQDVQESRTGDLERGPRSHGPRFKGIAPAIMLKHPEPLL